MLISISMTQNLMKNQGGSLTSPCLSNVTIPTLSFQRRLESIALTYVKYETMKDETIADIVGQ
ncbi:MAG: hypothetical protein JKY10_10330 [Cohaesibacteraceae bacterium]|nr:hypothetical protein [Cohaesibacteraceae bacterium]